jgi:hypothetical protein
MIGISDRLKPRPNSSANGMIARFWRCDLPEGAFGVEEQASYF